MNRLLLFLIFSSFLFSQMSFDPMSERLKKGSTSEYYEKAFDAYEFPFDEYGQEMLDLFLHDDFLEAGDISSNLLEGKYQSEKNDSLAKKYEESYLKAFLIVKKFKEKLDSFDLVYNKYSFEFVTKNGLKYDYWLLKRIYYNMYYELSYHLIRGYALFQDDIYDYNKNIDLSSSFLPISEYYHDAYLNLKEDKIFKGEVSVGGMVEDRISVEQYFLRFSETMQSLHHSYKRTGWYNDPALERFYASEFIKNVPFVITTEAFFPTLLGEKNKLKELFADIWKDRYRDNAKFRRTGQFGAFNPKNLTDNDYDLIARFYIAINYLEQLEYMNAVAGIYYDEEGNMTYSSGSALSLSYEDYYETASAILVLYDHTVRNNISYLDLDGPDFKRIQGFLLNAMQYMGGFHGDKRFHIQDIGIYSLSRIVDSLLNYAMVFKNNAYIDKYNEIVNLCVDLYELQSSIQIDYSIEYNRNAISEYVYVYGKTMELEIMINMYYDLYTDNISSSDLVSESREKLNNFEEFVNYYNLEEFEKDVASFKDVFELRVGMEHDIVKDNQLGDKNYVRDFDFYKEYFNTIKEKKDSDPSFYYGFFSGLIRVYGYDFSRKILSVEEIDDIYSYKMNKAMDTPAPTSLISAAQLDYELYAATKYTLQFLDHGFSVLSRNATVGAIKQFPERFTILGWFIKRYNMMQFYLEDIAGEYPEGKEAEIKELIDKGSYPNKEYYHAQQSILADNFLKSIIHSKKDDLTVLDYLEWSIVESVTDTTNFTLDDLFFDTKNYGFSPRIAYPDSLLIISYNFSVNELEVDEDYLINIMELYHPKEDMKETGFKAFDIETMLLVSEDIYQFKESIDVNKAMLKNNLINAFENESNDAIYNTLIKPIENRLKDFKNIIIIPDPFLENFPIESLKDKDGKFLIEKYNFSYASSFNQLLSDFSRKRYPSDEIDSIVFGDINYDSHPSFKTLEWSDNEIEYIHKNSIFKSTLYKGENATETNFKNLLNSSKNPIRLHLSLHAGNDLNHKKSSIVFAKDKTNDGELTYQEAERLDFSNINLIVLSACETNEGRTVNNFSHLTFQHLFKMNGASNVISTLWKIDDKATFYFMKELYDSINLYFYDTPEAVSNAKRNFIAKYPEYNHPYYWAGFSSYGF